ncbi:MAG: FAD-binding oxidoreductase [Gemmataceae bacterium]|nr:FAD-binding oxidoreductase [Gemmataceae bacterium]
MDFTAQKHEALLGYLRRHVDGEVRFDAVTRQLYSTDASIYQIEPVGVVIPKTAAALQTAVQIALEMHIPIVPRGGGTSLSGQSIGAGIVLDCSKHLNNILDIDPALEIARVQPGVILDQLNRALAPHDLMFGPDVATASRANLGGMIGNNSAGSHSIVHGKTIDHVRKLRVLLSDGQPHDLGPLSAADWQLQDQRTFLGQLHHQVRQIVNEAAPEIQRRFPRILRRVSGYNLDVLVNGKPRGEVLRTPGFGVPHPGASGLHHLLVGSEGTLGVILEAELNVVPRPKVVGLLIPQFSSLAAAMDALAVCLEMQPSAIELMDQMLIALARNNLSLRNTMADLTGTPAALFMVEFSGDDFRYVTDRIKKLQTKLQGMPGLIATLPAIEASQRQALWNLRNAAMPLLLGTLGDRKPVTFIEDTAVAPEHLPRYVARFREILKKHGTDGTFYGHASVGCLHIRPVLNIKDPNDVARMRRITEEVTDLVLEFDGSLSGEHGDGLARSEWNRKMFGDVVYDAFCKVKHAFDPDNLFNPGKIVHAPPMTENLRYDPGYQPAEPATLFDYSKQEGFARSIENCNGAGVCRKLQGGTMCPSFRATRDEKDSTRGRANILRLALVNERPMQALASDEVNAVLDLCLMCKACKSECPSNVDLAKLKAEVTHLRYQDRARPILHRMLRGLHRLNRWGSLAAPLVNLMQGNRLARWMLHHFVGIDRRRSLPALHFDHFRRWFARRQARGSAALIPPLGNVLLLDDCFTTYNEPAIGQAAVRVLEAAGYGVELAGLACCGRTLISKGYLSDARQLIQEQAPRLATRIASGMPILGLEPSCLLTLVDEWPELVPGSATAAIAKAAQLADGWLADQVRLGRAQLKLATHHSPLTTHQALLHGHCHQKALVGMGGTVALLKLIPGLDVRVLDTGCCGMAGSFGFETEHYDLSVQIAQLDLLPALAKQPDAIVVAPGTSCRHQIHDLDGRRALHPLELLAAALES